MHALLKKRLWRRCCPVYFANFLRTPLLSCCFGQKRFQERWENSKKSSLQKIYIFNFSSITDLTSRVSYYLFSLFFTAMAEKKKPGKENIFSKKELIVLRLCSGSKPTTMKFTREGPREYDKTLLGNIKESCTQHFKEKRTCNVLASEQDLHVRVWNNYLISIWYSYVIQLLHQSLSVIDVMKLGKLIRNKERSFYQKVQYEK